MAAALASIGTSACDVGTAVEHQLVAHSNLLFGFVTPLDASATAADVIPRQLATAEQRQLLAKGLRAEFVTRKVGRSADMIAFWPDDLHYTHLIVCIEVARSGSTPGGGSGYNPSVQRVDVATGQVETILYGMSLCDGLRSTPWGTILASEENGANGGAYEILDPLNTTGHWVANRGAQGGAADIRDGVDSPNPSQNVAKRTALVAQSWEGLDVLHNGVVLGGDELRPNRDTDGGAIFRFVPATPYACQGAPVRPGQRCHNPIHDLASSPLVAGRNYALATVCGSTADFGQGCETGRGLWVEVRAAFARADANARGATGYCRPEDLHVDRSSGMFAGGEGVRWCWTNTCGSGFGEVLCAVDEIVDADRQVFSSSFGFNLLSTDGASPAAVLVTRFVEGDEEMSSHDNLDFQPHTGNVYVAEDDDFGDIWACLEDGEDRDLRNDGCVRVLSIRDPAAEPSGFIFDGTGRVAYYHVQHGQQAAELLDFASNPVNGFTDDLVKITGFKVPQKK